MKREICVPGVIRYISLHQARFNDLTWGSHSLFLANRVVLAVAGPAVVERARDIDRSLLPSASPQE
jgi:hypothetical protein